MSKASTDRSLILSARNRAADAAYERELAPARLALSNPKRVPYPEAVKKALAAYDAVIEKWRK
jgi:hypothetical protein